MPEVTGPQVLTSPLIQRSTSTEKLTYAKLRKMRKDPVVALTRFMFFAGVYSGAWSFEKADKSAPDEWVDYVRRNFEPIRRHFLSTAALGCFDFGWQPFEKVIEPDLKLYEMKLTKLKPLMQDDTVIETDDTTGGFTGFTQGNVTVPLEKALLCSFDVEGTAWEGQSTLANAEEPYDAAKNVMSAVKRYDQKIAGAHWVVRYPIGVTPLNGVDTPNDIIAKNILSSLQSSGMIAIPLGKDQFQDIPTDQRGGWDIELITANGGSVDFNARFEYLDKAKVRALGFPERTLLEGVHGTKADAEAHQDFVITLIEYRHACLLEVLNWHLVNQLLRLTFGEEAENAVMIKAASLSDATRGTLKAVYDKIMSSPDGLLLEMDNLDLVAISETLGIPRRTLNDPTQLPDNLPVGGDSTSTGA